MKVRPKKHLGQHFLLDTSVSIRISKALSLKKSVLEIGPGTGALTQHLLDNKDVLKAGFKVCEVDRESILFLNNKYPDLEIIDKSFLELDLSALFEEPYQVVGNFPYNISSQILLHVLEHADCIEGLVGMFQKEVAQRVVSHSGGKTYGILSVLIQLYYDAEYLFDVEPQAFDPPPKVVSGVISLKRNTRDFSRSFYLALKKVVKTTFNQRRKMLRNTLKAFQNYTNIPPEFLTRRPESLSVEDFVLLTQILNKGFKKD